MPRASVAPCQVVRPAPDRPIRRSERGDSAAGRDRRPDPIIGARPTVARALNGSRSRVSVSDPIVVSAGVRH
eukprot:320058-Hanusia_phi.AAC.1